MITMSYVNYEDVNVMAGGHWEEISGLPREINKYDCLICGKTKGFKIPKQEMMMQIK
jgi:hypothetical protein